MKKLKFVSCFDSVKGNVIERVNDKTYTLRKYFKNEYGVDDVEDIDELTPEQFDDVISRPNLLERFKRLHNYFRSAEFVSSEVIALLNFEEDSDIFKTLKDVLY